MPSWRYLALLALVLIGAICYGLMVIALKIARPSDLRGYMRR
jgi:hypothetical protein